MKFSKIIGSEDARVLVSPAKVNLFLHILGKRTDGYHELQTLFQFLEFGDILTFHHSLDVTLDSNVSSVSNNENLIIKAIALLKKETGFSKGVSVTLDKKIPIGGGLGGASSNAATTLVGLNILWNLQLSIDELADLGLRLGADIPVFVRGHSALAGGVGEILTPVTPREYWYVLLIPEVCVNTSKLYAHPDLPRNSLPLLDDEIFNRNKWYNDFEVLVRSLYPEVDKSFSLLDNLTDFSVGRAMLSGSGACVYAPFVSQQAAKKALKQVASSDISGIVVRGVNNSPLWDDIVADGNFQ